MAGGTSQAWELVAVAVDANRSPEVFHGLVQRSIVAGGDAFRAALATLKTAAGRTPPP